MTTYTSIHRIKELSANTGPTLGSPLSIVAYSEDGARSEITFFVDSPALSRRLAEAVNDAVKPAETLTTHHARIVAELADVIGDAGCSLDEAKTLLRAALGEYENRLEDAYQRQQDSLTESGGPDDSAHRKQLIDAGRGHLLR